MIVAFLGSKGGSGKSTLAIHVAAAWALAGKRVLLLDSDTQGSALDWLAVRQGEALFPVVGLPKATLDRDVPRLAADFDHVVIDGAPRRTDVARAALLASDLAVFPVSPSPLDSWSVASMVGLAEETGTRAVFCLNRCVARATIVAAVLEALKADYGLSVLKSTLGARAGGGRAG